MVPDIVPTARFLSIMANMNASISVSISLISYFFWQYSLTSCLARTAAFFSSGVLEESKDTVLNDFVISLVGLQAGVEFLPLRNSAHQCKVGAAGCSATGENEL